ncbi:MAG: DUF3007 family protein [Coleofasciculaceae cyanobacterium SM2_3_26]|nr:DUF3007 family protein [Coleofasciculaceae cyanobacterium SM2_3_26]
MRRIDAIALGLGVFVAGGAVYVVLQLVGLDGIQAGVWTQVLLVAGLLGWLATYLLRAFTGKMTYNQQLQEYKDAVLEKQLEELSEEELAELKAKAEADKEG